MKEIYDFSINEKFAHLLFKENEGKNIEGLVKIVQITRDDPRFEQIGLLNKQIDKEFNSGFFLSWGIRYKYSKSEIEKANLFYFYTDTRFEPAGEECGTIYDEHAACKICGSNAIRKGPLILKGSSIPQKDISCTIAGEYVVSQKFSDACGKYKLNGILLKKVKFLKNSSRVFYELNTSSVLDLSDQTVAGVNPFDFSQSAEPGEYYIQGANYVLKNGKEIYKCPLGHLIGLNLLSEPFVKKSTSSDESDLFVTNQKIGVRKGLLRPESLFICSAEFRNMVVYEKLSGFRFIIARLD